MGDCSGGQSTYDDCLLWGGISWGHKWHRLSLQVYVHWQMSTFRHFLHSLFWGEICIEGMKVAATWDVLHERSETEGITFASAVVVGGYVCIYMCWKKGRVTFEAVLNPFEQRLQCCYSRMAHLHFWVLP